MRKLFFILLFTFTTIFTAFANGPLPGWVLPELRNYPLETYLFDVGRSEGVGEEAYRSAIAKAHKKLAEKVLKRAVSIIVTKSDHVNYQTVLEHYSAVLEDYCSWHHASPALQLKGLQHRNLSLDNARTEQETYAIVYIRRDKLRDIYKNQILESQRKIKSFLDMAKSAEKDLDINRTVRNYLRTFPFFEAKKEGQIVLIGLEYEYDANAFSKLVNAANLTNNRHHQWTHRQVIKRVKELQNNIIVNFNDICTVIDSQLSQQIDLSDRRASFYPLIYKDSEMISPFAQKFTNVLQELMPEWVFVDPMLELDQPPVNIDMINRNFPPLRLSASCWENGEKVTIRTTLRNINTGAFVASSVVDFMKTDMRDNIIYQPRGYNEAQKEIADFRPRYFEAERDDNTEISTSKVITEHQFTPIGGLKVELWTDKGRGPLTIKEGDKVKIFATVNQPVFLRLLNIHADQRRALLIDNFYIGPDRVNNNVEIGQFLCAPPFGTELVVVAARTDKFPNIETIDVDGYLFLKEKDRKKAAESFIGLSDKRGLKIITDEQMYGPQTNIQQNGAQLILKTMAK